MKLTGGRSSVAGAQVTVFGATGFMGRYVVNRLGKMGCRIIVPHRGDEIYARHLKPMGDLGAVNFYDMSIRSVEEIETAVAGSNVVVNLLGKHFETSRWSFQDVNASFPAVLGTVCAEQGVERLVHMSALGASVSSPSAWARSKAVGEENIRLAFPNTTILRPAPIYGDEDRLLNRIAKLSRALPVLPLVDGDAKQQPVFCDDVAAAVEECVANPACVGQTYSLCGPKVYTNKELTDYVFKTIADESNAVVLPRSIGIAMASVLQLSPNAWLTVDGLRMQTVDTTMPPDAPGLAELGVTEPVTIEDRADRYLMRFKKQSHFQEEDTIVQAPR
jgi:NADH dehydrogenase (ubiquinone) 1 alpha subcomplex subunit 9